MDRTLHTDLWKSETFLILKINTTFEDVEMMLKWFFLFLYWLQIFKISVECFVHIYSCPWLELYELIFSYRIYHKIINNFLENGLWIANAFGLKRVWGLRITGVKYIGKYIKVLYGRPLKVRQIWNVFFKPTFLLQKERTTLLLVDLFSFVFWKKVKTPKRHFKINWPLRTRERPFYH